MYRGLSQKWIRAEPEIGNGTGQGEKEGFQGIDSISN